MTTDHPVAVALENRLMSHGIYVTEFTWHDSDAGDANGSDAVSNPDDGAGFTVEYETIAEAPEITSQEVSAVVRTVLAIAEERSWTPGRVEARATTTEGEPRGEWHVERAWFETLGSTLSELEFSQRVLDTRTNRRDGQ
ncbi:hypothetical protein [Halosolutus gelatinilyticus]|uniref:hypothetical protein n=1 Tax=Halosolutus gelatinilyticus TaxID=2931975 RepID=UPI001FF47BFC|nr:hypothetical protein [Halosolutus gelatinilyticus]